MAKPLSPWRWFGVKTVYRTTAKGKPHGTDRFYDPDFSLVEERVVLFRARNQPEAMKRAEREAQAYAAQLRTRNPYGQQLVTRYLGAMDCYGMFDDLDGSGSEVFSSTQVVSRRTPDRKIVSSVLRPDESKKDEARRRNALDISMNKPAPGVRLTSEEQEFALRIRR